MKIVLNKNKKNLKKNKLLKNTNTDLKVEINYITHYSIFIIIIIIIIIL